MLQKGIVKKVYAAEADVEITRSSACGDNCASCGLCQGRTNIVRAKNLIGASEGDTVIVNMSDKKVLGAAFLVYIVPIIILLAGYIAGKSIFRDEAAAVISGFLMMALAFAVIIIADKKIKRRYTPCITEIISETEADA